MKLWVKHFLSQLHESLHDAPTYMCFLLVHSEPCAHLKPPVAIHCPNIARQVPKFLLIILTLAVVSLAVLL